MLGLLKKRIATLFASCPGHECQPPAKCGRARVARPNLSTSGWICFTARTASHRSNAHVAGPKLTEHLHDIDVPRDTRAGATILPGTSQPLSRRNRCDSADAIRPRRQACVDKNRGRPSPCSRFSGIRIGHRGPPHRRLLKSSFACPNEWRNADDAFSES
jgi:hypothetical protein